MYGNDSGSTLAATGTGLTILGISLPWSAAISIALVLAGLGVFALLAWRRRGRR